MACCVRAGGLARGAVSPSVGLQRSPDGGLDCREAFDPRRAATGSEASWRQPDGSEAETLVRECHDGPAGGCLHMAGRCTQRAPERILALHRYSAGETQKRAARVLRCGRMRDARHRRAARHPEREDYSPNLHQIWDTEIVERDMEISNPLRYADELDEKFQAESAAWEAAGIQVDNWVWESHERAETAVYGAFPEKIGIEPGMQLKSCADGNHMGKRMFDKHLAVGETYQSNAARAAETSLAEAGVRLAMILNDAARAAN